jgi:hypothetical protein
MSASRLPLTFLNFWIRACSAPAGCSKHYSSSDVEHAQKFSFRILLPNHLQFELSIFLSFVSFFFMSSYTGVNLLYASIFISILLCQRCRKRVSVYDAHSIPVISHVVRQMIGFSSVKHRSCVEGDLFIISLTSFILYRFYTDSRPRRLAAISHQPPTLLTAVSGISRYGNWSSLYSLGMDRKENTASNIYSIVKCYTAVT